MSSSAPSQRREDIITSTVQDEARLKALREYQILDTEPEPAFDRLTTLAAHLFDASTALVNFLDDTRQWFKSTVGFDERETGLDVSFCVYTLAADDVFVIEDLSREEPFSTNPFVTDHGIRFYAGAPLITSNGHRLGTLCVLDTEPQSPSAETLERLKDLAAVVVDELDFRREQAEHNETLDELEENRTLLRKSQQLSDIGGVAYDPQTDEVTWTKQTYRIFDTSPDADLDLETVLDFYPPESRARLQSELARLRKNGGQYDLELDVDTAEGNRRRVRTIAEAQRTEGTTTQIIGAVQDITEQHRTRRIQEAQRHFFERIATGAAPDEILIDITHFAEAELSDAAVSILRRDDDRLYHAAGPSLPPGFIEAVDGMEIGPEAGTCGTAAYHNRQIVTEDIRTDDRWAAFRDAAEQAGLRSCHSHVVRGSDDTVLGTFAVYRSEPGTLSSTEQDLLAQMAHVAGVALERAQRERALRASEERWRTLVDEHPGPITVTIDGTFAYANDATAAVLGMDTPDELIGTEVAPFIHPDDRDRLRERIRTISEDREPTSDTEYRVLPRDGTERIVRATSVPIQYRGNEAAQTMMWDVTERKEAERNLRQSREQLSMAVEGGNIGTWNWDLETGKVVFNDRWAGMLGYAREELDFHFSTWQELVHPEDLSRAMTVLEAYVEGERDTYTPEIRMRTKSGDWKWIQTIGKVIERDEDGAVTRAAGIHLDIDDRKRAEQALREAKGRYQTLIEHFPNGAVVLFDDDLRYTIAGGQELEEVDFSPADFEGSTPRDLFPPDFAETTIEHYRRALEGKKDVFEQTFRGQHYRLQTLPVRDDEGDVVAGMAVSQNITERVRRRQELEAAKEAAEEANRMKTSLLSNMNHELRTPLTSVITFSTLIQDNPEAAAQFIDRIVNGGKRLLYTLNTVVELAKLEGGDVSIDRMPLQLNEVVQSVVDHFQEDTADAVDLRTNLSAVHESVALDEHLTERILTHLVHNAVKFTTEGAVTITARTEADAAALTVTDTGIGIDPDFLPRVFDEFAQASSGSDRAYEGNGIGLTVVQRMVQRMNGTVDIESTPGEGTTVTVRLPLE